MEKFKSFISNKRYMRRLLIVAFCSVVLFSVLYVMIFLREPELNAPGALGSTYMDIVCMLIVLFLLLNLIFEKGEIGRTTKLFLALMLVTMWALYFDFWTWSLDGSLKYGNWTFPFTIASLCSGAVLGGILELYLSSYLNDMYNLKSIVPRVRVCVILNAAAFLLTITLALTHSAFEFVDGHYETGVLYDAITIIPLLTIIYTTCFIIRNVKIIGAHDVIAVVLYIVMLISGVIIEAVHGIGTTYVGFTVADVFIYVMLQNNLIESERKQKEELAKDVEKWMKRSNTDEVTGFLNRHAYEQEIEALRKRGLKDNFVYLSMDVNGLKVVNDTRGHDAGDELIIGASTCMRRCFGDYGKLYRIGGDEFVALIYANDIELDIIMREFDDISEEWQGKLNERLTISCGYVQYMENKEMSLHQMAVLADKRMYANKSQYYRINGIDRRGSIDAHVALHEMYTKIIKADLKEDTFNIVNMVQGEQLQEYGYSEKLSEWMHDFGTLGMVHEDDLSEYLEKTNPEYIKKIFSEGASSLRVFYRRKYDKEYRQVMLEMIPAGAFNDESQKLFIYVKDIQPV